MLYITTNLNSLSILEPLDKHFKEIIRLQFSDTFKRYLPQGILNGKSILASTFNDFRGNVILAVDQFNELASLIKKY